ncbi:MAG: efflux RND transporter periplasmic adaptor subunit [Candidatus Pacebacteria bacterium]|nr:efflux RND transporter periplasmic adaptor subunit [Candidatus Paceibacterota bacterium]
MIKKIIIVIFVIILAILAIYQFFLKKEKTDFSIEKVKLGTIVQEVSESGTVKAGEEINLGFKTAGRIEKIYVKVGDNVNSGNILAKIETSQISIQKSEAEASLNVAKAQLKSTQTSAANYEISLRTAEQNLEDVTAAAKESLNNSYEDALNYLDDSYLKIYNAFDSVKTIQQLYFSGGDQESIKVKDAKLKIEAAFNLAKSSLDAAKQDFGAENINNALSVSKESLEDASLAMAVIRQICDTSLYRDAVSSANKTVLDTHRANINTALTNLVNAQQAISNAEITYNTNTNSAKNQVLTAEGNLAKAKDDINLYEAQVKQSEENLNLLESQINDASIFAPSNGEIKNIDKEAGEIAQSSEPVISFISSGPFEIETNIYEEDIVKVRIGNPVDIKLTAFPDQIFSGKVISIDPAEKLIDGVVYYKVLINFENPPEGVRLGMTADITIKTAQKENVLIISQDAIEERDGKTFVQVVNGKNKIEREVQIGLRGSLGMVEVLSGLAEGEEVSIKQ